MQKGNVFTGVCLSTGGGVYPPWADTPQADIPLDRHSPGQKPPGQTPRADTPPRETAAAAGGTQPTGMHSFCFCSSELILKYFEWQFD